MVNVYRTFANVFLCLFLTPFFLAQMADHPVINLLANYCKFFFTNKLGYLKQDKHFVI